MAAVAADGECTFCLEDSKPSELFQPCLCTAPVHVKCLERWRTKHERGSRQRLQCSVCEYRYNITTSSPGAAAFVVHLTRELIAAGKQLSSQLPSAFEHVVLRTCNHFHCWGLKALGVYAVIVAILAEARLCMWLLALKPWNELRLFDGIDTLTMVTVFALLDVIVLVTAVSACGEYDWSSRRRKVVEGSLLLFAVIGALVVPGALGRLLLRWVVGVSHTRVSSRGDGLTAYLATGILTTVLAAGTTLGIRAALSSYTLFAAANIVETVKPRVDGAGSTPLKG